MFKPAPLFNRSLRRLVLSSDTPLEEGFRLLIEARGRFRTSSDLFFQLTLANWGLTCDIIGIYPLVNVYITNWKITIFNGKIHYKWQFSIAMLNYQRVL